MRYEIFGANPENLISADNFAFLMDLLSVVRLTTSGMSGKLSGFIL